MVLAIHDEQLAEHGGASGVRDEGLLDSALARPRNVLEYIHDADIGRIAAAYALGLARNHPFVDGNKRAALVSAYTVLALNDLELEAPEPEAVSRILGLSDGSLSEAELESWIRGHLVPWVE